MNHDVENDVDVGAAALEGRQAMTLDEAHRRQRFARGNERRVEPLDMADLELELALGGELREDGGLRARARHRFLDEHVHAVLEEEFAPA